MYCQQDLIVVFLHYHAQDTKEYLIPFLTSLTVCGYKKLLGHTIILFGLFSIINSLLVSKSKKQSLPPSYSLLRIKIALKVLGQDV